MSLNLKAIKDIINGKYDNVPNSEKKTVRIFISSTFTGFLKIITILLITSGN
jgi:hypothetical protein